jgi:hypothetical protein
MLRVDPEEERILLLDLAVLSRKNPRLYIVLASSVAFSVDAFGKVPLVTSIFRPRIPGEKASVHNAWRGADLRIYNRERDGSQDKKELRYEEALTLMDWLNRTFTYGRKWNMKQGATAVIHGEGPNLHIHLQTRNKGAWS